MEIFENRDKVIDILTLFEHKTGVVSAQGKNKNPAFLRDAFKGLVELKKLNLARNDIAEIAASQFAKMENLVEVNLDWNKLTDIPATAFEGCPELKYVFIRNNQVRINIFSRNYFPTFAIDCPVMSDGFNQDPNDPLMTLF